MDPARRKRINLYKKIIIAVVLLSILIPLVLCVVLLGQVCSLRKEIESLDAFQSSIFAEMQNMTTDEAESQPGQEQNGTAGDVLLMNERILIVDDEKEIADLDAEIRLRKSEAKRMSSLADKVAAQREIKEMERKRAEKRMNLFEAQDEIDAKKEDLLVKIEQMLEQKIDEEELFTIRWRIV
mgnify:CR=1 FL=1